MMAAMWSLAAVVGCDSDGKLIRQHLGAQVDHGLDAIEVSTGESQLVSQSVV